MSELLLCGLIRKPLTHQVVLSVPPSKSKRILEKEQGFLYTARQEYVEDSVFGQAEPFPK